VCRVSSNYSEQYPIPWWRQFLPYSFQLIIHRKYSNRSISIRVQKSLFKKPKLTSVTKIPSPHYTHQYLRTYMWQTQMYTHYYANTDIIIQGVPLATEPGISLIILTSMKILQRNLNRITFLMWEMKRKVFLSFLYRASFQHMKWSRKQSPRPTATYRARGPNDTATVSTYTISPIVTS
jgi:hypothetical protein